MSISLSNFAKTAVWYKSSIVGDSASTLFWHATANTVLLCRSISFTKRRLFFRPISIGHTAPGNMTMFRVVRIGMTPEKSVFSIPLMSPS